MPYVSVKHAAHTLGVSDAVLLDWMDRGLIPTEPGPDGVRRLPDTSVDAVLAQLPTHSDRHGLSDEEFEAILHREFGPASGGGYSTPRATPWQTVKAFVSAWLHWPT